MQSAATIDSARAVVAAHSSITTWALVGVIAVLIVVIVALIRHHGGWGFLSEVPTTNLRILVGIGLSILFIVVLMASGYATKVWPPVEVILAIGGFLLVSMGLDVTQYGVKRTSENPQVIAAYAAAGATGDPPVVPPAGSVPTPPAAPVAATNAKAAVAAHKFSKGD